ncbi:MAG: hypothetical protein BGO26_08210 [Actinobacteria bacterium 69-20]|nr:hypothetical protein [Actinomycetota bacterium]OJV30301.1 MAG: hypothetical protein BGO26_08210 [Actinobacteria bacterium 69-20]
MRRAAAAWSEVAAAYAEYGDALGAARASRELGMLAWRVGDIATASDRLDSAERILDGLEPSEEHARLLHARVVASVRLGNVDAVRMAATRLQVIAATLGSPSIVARAHLAEGALRYAETDYAAAAEADRRGLEAALASDEPLLVLRAYDQLSVTAAAQLDVVGLREHSQASADLADSLGSLSLAGWPHGRLAIAALLGGDWDAALRGISKLAGIVSDTGERRGQVSVCALRAWILTRHGQLAEARDVLDQAHRLAGAELPADRNIFVIVALAETIWALAADEPERALGQRAALEDLSSGWLPLLALAEVGQAAMRCGDVQGGRGIARRLRSVRSCVTAAPAVLADWLDGHADCTAACPGAGVPKLRAAASGFERLGLPFHAARAGLAVAYADSDRARAVDQGRTSLTIFERLGAAQQAEQTRSMLRSYGVTPSRGRARHRTGSRLSARELEVGCLVAAGLSNADVATRLFISPRTVSTHLERIYSKLELTSRVALTRYLADSGLLARAAATRPHAPR